MFVALEKGIKISCHKLHNEGQRGNVQSTIMNYMS